MAVLDGGLPTVRTVTSTLGIWYLVLLTCNGQVQVPMSGPTIGELNAKVDDLFGRFMHFQGYVEEELTKLRACKCQGGAIGNSQYPRGVDLSLTRARVDVKKASPLATFKIEYKAFKEARVIWRVNTEPAAISGDGVITKEFRNGIGKATLLIDRSKEIVASVIVDHVTIVLSFRANPNASSENNYPPTNFHVDAGPHGSISYTKGAPMRILVNSPKVFPGYSSNEQYQWSFWMANTTAVPPKLEEYPQWREMQGSMVRVGPIRTLERMRHPTDLKVMYELMTNKGDYDGILIFSKHYTAQSQSNIISSFTEMRYVFVHRSDRYDPFPKGFIAFVRRDPPLKPCIFNQTCSIACQAVGVVPEGIVLYKVQIDKSLVEVNLPKLEVREPYMLYAHYGIKEMMEEDEGEYICYTYSGNKHAEIKTTIMISEPVVFVNSSSGINDQRDSVSVTCAAKGRPLPHITMFENYAYQGEIRASSRWYLVERTVNRVRGDHIATIKVTINKQYTPPHLWRIICMADNPFELTATDYQLRAQPPSRPPGTPQWNQPRTV